MLGNFERAMVAYISGQVGDCEVGSAQAEMAAKEIGLLWFEENISYHPDEHGCWRPADSEPTPGWWNDGHGLHFRDSEYVSGPKFPAYQSVSMAVLEWPPDDILKIIIQRAKYFAEYRPEDYSKEPITITTVRFVDRTMVEKTIKELVVHEILY